MATPVEQFEGKYEILEKIAEGGMGAVYKVRHRLLDVIRVIKVMRPQIEAQKGTKERFLREARLAIKMRHPNIAQLDDFSIDENGNAFIVMEYIDGITLQEYLQRFGMPPIALTLEVIRQALQALGYLHRKHVIHRDISPDNLMLGADENDECQVKLIDLGIAKTLQADAAGLTATGMFVGKVRYASPEHFRTEEGVQIDRWSDLYSLGLVLYELLTGKHPIVGDSFSTLIAGHLFRPPMDFATSDPEGKVPEDLREVVLKSLAKAPEDRYQQARDFREALAAIQARYPLSQAEFDESFRLRRQDMPTLRMRRPGSTQDRLDAEFRSSRNTPAPEGATSSETAMEIGRTMPPEVSAEVARRDAAVAEQTQALVQAAERLLQLNLFKEARVQLRSVLERDPGNGDATALLGELEAREARVAAVGEAAAAIRAQLEVGELDEAQDALAAAVAAHGEDEAFAALHSELQDALQSRARQRASELLAEAAGFEAAGDLVRAVACAEQAHEAAGESSEVAGRLAELRHAKRQHDEELARAARVVALRSEASEHQGRGEHQLAVSKLEQAVALLEDDEELRRELAAAEKTLEAQRAEEARAALLATALEEIETELAVDRFAEARGRIESARAELGDDEAFDRLARRVDDAEARARDRAVDALVREAQSLLADGKFRSAIKRLEKGLAMAPDNTGVQAQLEDSREAFERHQRAERIAKAVAAVESQLDAGRLDEAVVAAAAAIEAEGECDELKELMERAKALQALAEAEKMAAAEDAAEARRRAEEAKTRQEEAARLAEKEAAEEQRRRAEEEAVRRAADERAAKERAEKEKAESERAAKERAKEEARAAAAGAAAASVVDSERPTAPIPHKPSREDDAPTRPTPSPVVAPLTREPSTARRADDPAASKRRRLVMIGGAAAVAVVIIALVAMLGGDRGGGVSGGEAVLVITAQPWAEVLGVVDGNGNPVDLPAGSFTPCRLVLPPGQYTVTLGHPDSETSQERQVELRAGAQATAEARFGEPDEAEFLASYGL